MKQLWNRKGKRLLATLLAVLLVWNLCPQMGFAVSAAASTVSGNEATPSDAKEATEDTELDEDELDEFADGDLENDLASPSDAEEVDEAELLDGILEATPSDAVKEKAFEQSQTIDGITVRVTADEGVFPEDAKLHVELVEDTQLQEQIQTAVEETTGAKDDPKKTVEKTMAFDITILDGEGNELQPDNEQGQVKVSFEKVDTANVEAGKSTLEVFHLNEDNTQAEKLDAEVDVDAKTVEVQAEHFSTYVVTEVSTQAATNAVSVTLADNTTTTYHDTMELAIAYAKEQEGSTVALEADVETTADAGTVITLDSGTYTIDTKGHTWTLTSSKSSTSSRDCGVKITKANVTFTDSTGESGTVISNCWKTIYLSGYTNDRAGTLTIQSGTYKVNYSDGTNFHKGAYAVFGFYGSNITITGGTVTNDMTIQNTPTTITGGTFGGTYTCTQCTDVVLSGGTFAKITVAQSSNIGFTTVGQILKSGCAFYDNTNKVYISDKTVATVSNVTVHTIATITPVSATASATSVDAGYITVPILQANFSVDPSSYQNQLTYQWCDGNGKELTVGSGLNTTTYTLPLDLAAGTYQYKLKASINVAEAYSDTITIIVNCIAGEGSVTIENWAYGDDPKAPNPVSATNGVDHVKYTYKEKNADGAVASNWSSSAPTKSGEYTIKATFAQTTKYGEVTAYDDFTITALTYDENGFAHGSKMDYYEPAKVSNNVYQIANAGNLYWFASLVNGDNTHIIDKDSFSKNSEANAVLTTDITLNEGVLDANGNLNETGKDSFNVWTPIGTYSIGYTDSYEGTFDGQGHTISGLYTNDSTKRWIGLFGYVYVGVVQNVNVTDSYLVGQTYVGGIAGDGFSGKVLHCSNSGTVTGTSNVGGIVGQTFDSGSSDNLVENCYNSGNVIGNDCVGGIVGENINFSQVMNCFNRGTVTGTSNVGNVYGKNNATITNCYSQSDISAEGYQASELAWKLNTTNGTAAHSGIWSLDTDAPAFAEEGYPAVFRVLFQSKLDNADVALYLQPGDTVTVPSGVELAEGVTVADTMGTEDVTYAMKAPDAVATVSFTDGGTEDVYTFDQAWTKAYANGNATITLLKDCETAKLLSMNESNKNITLDLGVSTLTMTTSEKIAVGIYGGTLTIKGTTGSLIHTGHEQGSVFLVSSGNLYIEGGNFKDTDSPIYGCSGSGTINISGGTFYKGTDDNSGSIYNGSGVNKVLADGCVFYSVDADGNIGNVMTVDDSTTKISESVAVAPVPVTISKQPENGKIIPPATSLDLTVTAVTVPEDSGKEITYQWYQGSVEEANKIENATKATYTVTQAGDYLCTVTCAGYTLTSEIATVVKEPAQISGVYQLSTAEELMWFAAHVNETSNTDNQKANAVLTANIDMAGITWTPIGNVTTPYAGIFDGAGKTISNLSLTATANDTGLFGVVSGGTVQNLTAHGSIDANTDSVKYIGGIVGRAKGGAVLSGLESQMEISGKGKVGHVGGVVGSCESLTGTLTVSKCLFSGSINLPGANDSIGGIMGYAQNDVTIENSACTGNVTTENNTNGNTGGILGYINNSSFGGLTGCYVTGTITCGTNNSNGAIIGKINNNNAGSNVSNNYHVDGTTAFGGTATNYADAAIAMTNTQFASGEVTYLLNGSTSTPADGEALVWYQNIGTDKSPVLESTGSNTVYQLTDGTYSNTAPTTTDLLAGLAGISVSLDGNIGINYYVKIDDSVKDTAFIRFTLQDGTVQEIKASTVTPEAVSSLGTGNYYKLTCKVTSVDMTQTVKAQMFTGSEDQTGGTPKTYSVRNYADMVLEGNYSKNSKEMLRAMLNYGGYVQTNFNRNMGYGLANEGLYTQGDDPVLVGTDWDLTAYPASKTGNADGFTLSGVSLVMDSETALRIYYTLADGKTLADYNITLNGADGGYTTGSNNKGSYLEIANIAANALDTKYTINISPNGTSTDKMTLEYYPLSNAEAIITGSYDDKEKNMMKALVLYSRAAEAYEGGQ